MCGSFLWACTQLLWVTGGTTAAEPCLRCPGPSPRRWDQHLFTFCFFILFLLQSESENLALAWPHNISTSFYGGIFKRWYQAMAIFIFRINVFYSKCGLYFVQNCLCWHLFSKTTFSEPSLNEPSRPNSSFAIFCTAHKVIFQRGIALVKYKVT